MNYFRFSFVIDQENFQRKEDINIFCFIKPIFFIANDLALQFNNIEIMSFLLYEKIVYITRNCRFVLKHLKERVHSLLISHNIRDNIIIMEFQQKVQHQRQTSETEKNMIDQMRIHIFAEMNM